MVHIQTAIINVQCPGCGNVHQMYLVSTGHSEYPAENRPSCNGATIEVSMGREGGICVYAVVADGIVIPDYKLVARNGSVV